MDTVCSSVLGLSHEFWELFEQVSIVNKTLLLTLTCACVAGVFATASIFVRVYLSNATDLFWLGMAAASFVLTGSLVLGSKKYILYLRRTSGIGGPDIRENTRSENEEEMTPEGIAGYIDHFDTSSQQESDDSPDEESVPLEVLNPRREIIVDEPIRLGVRIPGRPIPEDNRRE